MPLQPLPIDNHIPTIRDLLGKNQNLVLSSSPGSGKTTRVPWALLSAIPPDKEIFVLVPRRLAARLAATRVAFEQGEKLGDTVGYQFRFENVGGPHTRLRFVTEGILMRRLLAEPTLPQAGMVILDEFHERHLQTDVTLSYLRELQKTKRPDLKLVAMSATIDMSPLARFLDASTYEVKTPVFPLEITYKPSDSKVRLDAQVASAVQQVIAEKKNSGDILVFLPGKAEINYAAQALQPLAIKERVALFQLHGELAKEDQQKALEKCDRRKVILSTNIAESSLTIDGVSIVIDSGLHRQASFSWWSGIPRLTTKNISQASAIQRAGRAARQGPGLCVRLYSAYDFDSRAPFETPEIARADLAQTCLEIFSLGFDPSTRFPWFESPPPASLLAATELLHHLGAVDKTNHLTPLGKRLATIPAHPRLGALLLTGEKEGVLEEAANLATYLSEGKIEEPDLITLAGRAVGDPQRIKIRNQMISAVGAAPCGRPANSNRPNRGQPQGVAPTSNNTALSHAILAAFPDRVAARRVSPGGKKSAQVDLVFCGEGAAQVSSSLLHPEDNYVVVADVRETVRGNFEKLHVNSFCSIAAEDLLGLDNDLLTETSSLSWDEKRKGVFEKYLVSYGKLILDESQKVAPPSDAAVALLVKEGLGLGQWAKMSVPEIVQKFAQGMEQENIETVMARIHLLAQHMEGFSALLSPTGFIQGLQKMASGATTLKAWKEISWNQAILHSLSPQARSQLENQTPTSWKLPKGRVIPITYEWNQPPKAASKLQDFFGVTKTPVIAQGKVKLAVHLLAPNKRPAQVTSDLEGFWKTSYAQVRKELFRRYPRQDWPEKPF